MLKTIKTIHTIIWLIMACASFYILYAGITNTFDIFVIISLILLTLETIVLLINKWTFPLTPLARKHTTNPKDNFDIYLPNRLAKYNKIIFGGIFILGVVLIILNTLFR